MSFIRRILSHSFLLMLLAVAALAWYFRADIFPGDDKNSDQTAAQDEGIVTVKSSDDIDAEENKNQPASPDSKDSSQGQTVFGGNGQSGAGAAPATQADMSKYRPLEAETPNAAASEQSTDTSTSDSSVSEQNSSETQQQADAGNAGSGAAKYRPLEAETPVAPEGEQSTDARSSDGNASEESGSDPQQQADAGGSGFGPAKYRPLTPEAEAVSESQETDTASPEVATTAEESDPVVQPQAQAGDAAETASASSAAENGEASPQRPVNEDEPVGQDQAAATEAAPAAQQAPAVVAAPENIQPSMPATQPSRTSQAMGLQPSYPPPVAAPVFPDSEPLSQDEIKLLSSARQAFWQRDAEKAEKDYKALIEMQADNPDPYGELGNVYYSTGKWDKAAEMYHEAGTRLIKRKQYGQAMHMMSVLRGLDAERASALEKSLNEALPRPGQTGAAVGE